MEVRARAHKYEPGPEQSIELLKELHILTQDGKLNQDTRRKLKQVQHLLGFIEPLITKAAQQQATADKACKPMVHVVDHGAGKSYLGFLLYDAYFKAGLDSKINGTVTGVEARTELVEESQRLAQRFGFTGMAFLNASVAQSSYSTALPPRIDIVTALHACDTATDDAIAFGLAHKVQHMVLVPCCQAEMAACWRRLKPTPRMLQNNPLAQLWRRPIHAREFGSQLTNVLRCLQLEAHGYNVTVTELVGWEHSMKNELLVASKLASSPASLTGKNPPSTTASALVSATRLAALLEMSELTDQNAGTLRRRFLG